jgi:DNA adenine methylase
MDPFLKWAGGKRWLITKSINVFPEKLEFNRYFEPFLGGGAVFFHLQPSNGFLSDINPDLINSYIVVRDSWADLIEILLKYEKRHCKEFYYSVRESKPETSLLRAARFIYLNRTCWNGLYRVNKNGDFNVPIGTKNKVILKTDDFQGISKLLNKMEIGSCDFEETINKADEGDFVFIDPPYTVKHNLNGFLKYNETIFSWEDQMRLKTTVSKAINRGASVLILNADHSSIRTLYEGIGNKVTLERASVIAGDSKARGIFNELVIKCW